MALIRFFLDISLFNKGPQDGPDSLLLLFLAVLTNLAVGIGLSAMDADWPEAVAQAAVAIVLLGGFIWGALFLTSKVSRFVRTSTAAFGCDTLVSILAVPLLVWVQQEPEVAGVVSLLLSLLMLWQMAVIGHILRHALSIPFIAGLGLALAYMVASYRIVVELFHPGA